VQDRKDDIEFAVIAQLLAALHRNEAAQTGIARERDRRCVLIHFLASL
jgi:hypothetical protein